MTRVILIPFIAAALHHTPPHCTTTKTTVAVTRAPAPQAPGTTSVGRAPAPQAPGA